MKNIFKNLILVFTFVILFCTSAFAAKYTMCTGKEFNSRIKIAVNANNPNTAVDRSILEFKRNFDIPEGATLIDISEDGDSSVVAYIENNIIYYVAEDDVYFNQDMSHMFDGFLAIEYINLQEFEFSKFKKANYMFANCISLINLDLDNDTDINLTEMEGMFYNCQSISNLYLYMLDTRKVTSFKNLFNECRNLKNIEVHLEKFYVKNVKDFTNTFKHCYMLKTNTGKKAISIDESKYKTYARCGDDDTEGLLKDFDYEYDDYGEKDGSYEVDSIFNTVVTTENLSDDDVLNAITFFDAQLATDSSLISVSAKDSNLLQNIDVEAILRAESTFVPDLEERSRLFKMKQNQIENSEVEEDEIPNGPNLQLSNPNEKTYDDILIDENYESYKPADNSMYFVTIFILIVIIIGLLMYKRKSKKETDEIDKPFDN